MYKDPYLTTRYNGSKKTTFPWLVWYTISVAQLRVPDVVHLPTTPPESVDPWPLHALQRPDHRWTCHQLDQEGSQLNGCQLSSQHG